MEVFQEEAVVSSNWALNKRSKDSKYNMIVALNGIVASSSNINFLQIIVNSYFGQKCRHIQVDKIGVCEKIGK